MAKTPGFVEYVDDRDPTIKDVIIDGSKRASEWFEDSRVDSNGAICTYLFSKDNHESFKNLAKQHDDEFSAWMKAGGAKK